MGGSVTFKLNTKQAIGQLKKYEKNTQFALKNVMIKTSTRMAVRQRATLMQRVQKWTGRLSNAIQVTKKRWNLYWIGPEGRVKYDWFIEDGSQAPPTGGGFRGYDYVRLSVTQLKASFERAVKAAVEKNK